MSAVSPVSPMLRNTRMTAIRKIGSGQCCFLSHVGELISANKDKLERRLEVSLVWGIENMKSLSGRCLCGSVSWTAADPILWAALCHCEDCRRAASSDYVSWLGVEREHVVWSGPRKTYRSSPNVERSFCEDCGSPLSFESFPTKHTFTLQR